MGLFGQHHLGMVADDWAALLVLLDLLLVGVLMVHGILVLRWVRRWLKQRAK